jgi:hypothetical protein
MTEVIQANRKIFMMVHQGIEVRDFAKAIRRTTRKKITCPRRTAQHGLFGKLTSNIPAIIGGRGGQLRGSILQELQQAEAACRWCRFGRPQAKGCGAPAPN